MDVRFLHNLIDILKLAGSSINEDLVPVLYNSLIKLQSENHFDAVYLWGRVVTLSDDYYIAYGYQKDPIKNRIFFYTQNILEWIIMPTDWSTNEVDFVQKLKRKFKGNPRHIETETYFDIKPKNISKPLLVPPESINDEYFENGESQNEETKRLESDIFGDNLIALSEIDETLEMDVDTEIESETVVMDGSNFKIVIKEENRLAITVLMIDYEGHIVPRGYYYKLPDENIIKAPHFKGLSYSEIGDEKNFLHINTRYPECKINKERPDFNGSIDFLGAIDDDLPKGCWASRLESNRYFIIHSLLWPGVVFIQDMNTSVHGFFYNGDGIKNLDLPFMI